MVGAVVSADRRLEDPLANSSCTPSGFLVSAAFEVSPCEAEVAFGLPTWPGSILELVVVWPAVSAGKVLEGAGMLGAMS